MNDVAEQIVALCDHEPANNVEHHPKLFSDLEDDRVSEALFKLWRKGILDAEWDDDEQATTWALNHFGVELCERGLLDPYVRALETDIQIDASPSMIGGVHE